MRALEAPRATELTDAQRAKLAGFSLAKRNARLHRLPGGSEMFVWAGPNRRDVLMLAAAVHFLGALVEVSVVAGDVTFDPRELEERLAGRSAIDPELSGFLHEL